MSESEENISFFIDEDNNENNIVSDFNINELLNTEYIFKDEDDLCANFIHYDINYKLKQLLRICEYYGIEYYGTSKDIRINKCNKSDVINTLIIYESNIENLEKVNKRKCLWHYINELKKDKFMKKYVLWN
jgi:hypothetical protein